MLLDDYLGRFFCHPWKTIVAREHEQCEEGLDPLEQNSEKENNRI